MYVFYHNLKNKQKFIEKFFKNCMTATYLAPFGCLRAKPFSLELFLMQSSQVPFIAHCMQPTIMT